MPQAPKGMTLDTLLSLKPEWAYSPCLYIIKQMFPGNNAYRMGASGTQLFKGTDLVYGSDRAGQLKGLLSRCSMYNGFWQPLEGRVFAALRIRQQLVVAPGQRVGESDGEAFNITRGNQTLVLQREKEMHTLLDERGYRWKSDKRNELFVPNRGVEDLIAAMRQIRGEEMYLLDEDSIYEDNLYRGGRVRGAPVVQEVGPRLLPQRQVRDYAPNITLKLKKEAIEQLRGNDPVKYATLVDIVKLVANLTDKPKATTVIPPPAPATIAVPAPAPPPADDDFDDDFDDADSDAPTVVTLPVAAIAALRDGGDDAAETAAAVAQLVTELPRRPQTRAQTKAAQQPRRSARIAAVRAAG